MSHCREFRALSVTPVHKDKEGKKIERDVTDHTHVAVPARRNSTKSLRYRKAPVLR